MPVGVEGRDAVTSRGGKLGGDGLEDPHEAWKWGKEDCSWCCAGVLRMSLGDWVCWGTERTKNIILDKQLFSEFFPNIIVFTVPSKFRFNL